MSVFFSVFALILAITSIVLVVLMYFNTRKSINNTGSETTKSVDDMNKLLQTFAADVDKKFLYYIHDPNQIIDLSSGSVDIRANGNAAKITMGASHIQYDPVAETLSFKPSPSGAKILMTKDYVDLAANGNKVKIGNHYLKSVGPNMQLCDVQGKCKAL